MTVYVDNMRAPYGRMVMCHLIADSLDELRDFARRLDLKLRWSQGDHYDICLKNRARAIEMGAQQVDKREMVRLRRALRVKEGIANRKRKEPDLPTKLAATLLTLVEFNEETGALERIIPYEHGKMMSAEQIISLFQFDHDPVRHENGGPDEPWNLPPKLIAQHAKKTTEIDMPASAKSKRIRGITGGGPKHEIPARAGGGWPPKGTRKMQSKPFKKRGAR